MNNNLVYSKILAKNYNILSSGIGKENKFRIVVSVHFIERLFERFSLDERDEVINVFIPQFITKHYCILLYYLNADDRFIDHPSIDYKHYCIGLSFLKLRNEIIIKTIMPYKSGTNKFSIGTL